MGDPQLLEWIKKLGKPVSSAMVTLLGIIDLSSAKVWLREDEVLGWGREEIRAEIPFMELRQAKGGLGKLTHQQEWGSSLPFWVGRERERDHWIHISKTSF